MEMLISVSFLTFTRPHQTQQIRTKSAPDVMNWATTVKAYADTVGEKEWEEVQEDEIRSSRLESFMLILS